MQPRLAGESGTGSPQAAADAAPQPVEPSPAPIGAAADMTPPAADVPPAESAPSATAAPGPTAASGNAAPAAAAEPPAPTRRDRAAEPPVTAAEAPATDTGADFAVRRRGSRLARSMTTPPTKLPIRPTSRIRPRLAPSRWSSSTKPSAVRSRPGHATGDDGPDALTLAHPADSVVRGRYGARTGRLLLRFDPRIAAARDRRRRTRQRPTNSASAGRRRATCATTRSRR